MHGPNHITYTRNPIQDLRENNSVTSGAPRFGRIILSVHGTIMNVWTLTLKLAQLRKTSA